uniref:Uncharacterized protein n=1 Tax=Sipha flava TaxID=143950 RepID=A0A2S2QEY9_9HEMI
MPTYTHINIHTYTRLYCKLYYLFYTVYNICIYIYNLHRCDEKFIKQLKRINQNCRLRPVHNVLQHHNNIHIVIVQTSPDLFFIYVFITKLYTFQFMENAFVPRTLYSPTLIVNFHRSVMYLLFFK